MQLHSSAQQRHHLRPALPSLCELEGGLPIVEAARGPEGAVGPARQQRTRALHIAVDGGGPERGAAERGHVEPPRHVVAALLEGGADRTLRATGGWRKGKTALEIAEARGKAEVAALLRE